MSQDPTAQPSPQELIAAIRKQTEQVKALHQELAAESEQLKAESARKNDERAAAARRGELGPQWQRLQQRIDMGQTSLTKVMSGKDDSPEAHALLRIGYERGMELKAQFAEELAESGDADGLLAESQQVAASLADSLARLQELNRQFTDPN